MRILAFDTSNRAMTVALTEDETVLAEKTVNVKRNHSIQLMPAIEELIEEIGWSIQDIDRISVAKGPGSYTGIRIAVSVAKTLAWTLDCDLVGVSSLQVLAMNANFASNHLIVPLFDARRENIYTGLYRADSQGELESVEADTHISSEDWAAYLKKQTEPIIFVGEDVDHFKERFAESLNDKFLYSSQINHLPQASMLAKIALKEDSEAAHSFVPEYLKLTEAEEKWNETHTLEEGGSLVEKI